jgi:hypothetical protein
MGQLDGHVRDEVLSCLQIAPAVAVTAVTQPGTTVAFFDAARLGALCQRRPEHVVAVLERLG